MSDALTDIRRDTKRSQGTRKWARKVLDYLRDEGSKEDIYDQAEKVDSIGRGYWQGRTDLVSYTDKVLDDLEDGNMETWKEFLEVCNNNHSLHDILYRDALEMMLDKA